MSDGSISAERALNYSFVGPNLRAAGVDYDVRVVKSLFIITKILISIFPLELLEILMTALWCANRKFGKA